MVSRLCLYEVIDFILRIHILFEVQVVYLSPAIVVPLYANYQKRFMHKTIENTLNM